MRVSSLLWLGATLLPASNAQNAIQKVVGLLNQMKDELVAEAGKDKKLFEDLKCWCKKNTKAKTSAIESNTAASEALAAEITKYAGNSGQYEAQMNSAETKVKDLESQFSTAEADHEETMKTLRAEETDLTGNAGSLEAAVKILEKHFGLLQTNPEVLSAVQSIMHDASEQSRIRYGTMVSLPRSFLQASTGVTSKLASAFGSSFRTPLPPSSATKVLSAFLQNTGPSHLAPHSPASGQILGVLKQMLDDANGDLKAKTEEIANEKSSYKKLKKALQEQLKAQRKSFEDNKAALSRAKFLKVEGAAELKKLREAIQADKDVLGMLNSKCRDLDVVFAQRTKDRDSEIGAVDKALEILTSDENRAALHPSMFLQVASRKQSGEKARRNAAVQYLERAAKTTPSWEQMSYNMMGLNSGSQVNKKLMLVAQQMKLRDFSEVITMIDKMVADIKNQKADESKKRDTCNSEIAATVKSIKETNREKDLTASAIEETEETIEEKKQEKEAVLAKLAETKESILEAGSAREEENKTNQQTITEAREMNAVIKKAYTVLKNEYAKESLLQQKQDPSQAGQVSAMPGDFEGYKKNQGANGVLTMMEKIIADVETSEKDTLADEAKSQAEYEQFIIDSNASVKADEAAVADLISVIASEGAELNALNTQSADLDTDLKDLAATETGLHNDCDFLIKYFSDRQNAMAGELESLSKAKAFLSGMKK